MKTKTIRITLLLILMVSSLAAAGCGEKTAAAEPKAVLAVNAPSDGAVVTAKTTLFTGTADPDAQIAITTKTAAGQGAGKTVAGPDGVWSANIDALVGVTVVSVTASLPGHQPTKATVTIERKAPDPAVAAAKKKAAAKRAEAARQKAAASRKREADRKRRSEAAAAAKQASNCITIPNVVGHNHQAAQDTMQAAGLFMLDEVDASGRGRMLVWDRNWVVVSQDPPGGRCVSENTTITLSSKKIGE
ncbi:MAG: PASTA domain-containing protein [Actinomycetes bacterium]